jgi:MFS family permease
MRLSTYRRNFFCLLGDAIFYGLAITFANTTTILPNLVQRLTNSQVAVGLFSAATSGAWLLPQVIYGRFLTAKRRKKPYLILGTAIGRPFYLFFAAALWWGLRDPWLAAILLFAVQVIFMASDAMASVAWFDIYAKAIPADRRGRWVGIGQAVRGILAFGSGAIIAALLGERGPPFPRNYAAIFALAGGFLLLSLGSIGLIREPDEPVEQERLAWRDYLPQLATALRQNLAFRRLLIVRLLAGCDALALAFYIVFATRELGLSPDTAGLFTVVQTVGGILASLGLGWLSERVGNHRVVQVSTALSLTAPLLGLVLALAGAPGSTAVMVLYAWVFLVVGVTLSALMLGFFNYALELAPAGQRPTYIGLFNSISGLLVLPPLLGGWLLQSTSYAVLFAVTAAVLALAHVLTWRLPAQRPAAR